jgi:hypothetical protein
MTLHAFLLSPSLPLADWPATLHLLGAFALHLFFSLILVFVLYYQKSKRRTYAFSFLLIGAVVFLLSFLLSDIKIKLGLALGLFAIFGIIRYRTLQIPIREMTYLFTTIGMAVINALTAGAMSLTEIVASNLVLLALFAFKEKVSLFKNLEEKNIVYVGIDKVHPGQREALIAELREKTGLPIERIGVMKYNLMKDTAVLKLYYHSNAGSESEDSMQSDDGDDD